MSAFKITDTNGKTHIEMDKAGKVKQDGNAIVSINKSGIVFNLQGKVLARLRDSGVLEDSNGKPLVKISTDGVIDNDSGVLISWSKDGMLSDGTKTLDAKLLPSNSTAHRAASIVYFLYSDFQKAKTTESK